MNNKVKKEICLYEEVETSIKLIKKGLADLQNMISTYDYHIPILLLSSGFERLIKCLLCLASIDVNTTISVIPFRTSAKEGHNLDLLLNKLISICIKKNYDSKFPAARTDINFLVNDKDLRKIVSILSDFGQGARYYNLDIVLKGKSRYKDPQQIWDAIEMSILLKNRKNLNEITKIPSKKLQKDINREIIIILEKFARALARLFTLADFGNFAEKISGAVHDFLFLMDKDLGTKKY